MRMFMSQLSSTTLSMRLQPPGSSSRRASEMNSEPGFNHSSRVMTSDDVVPPTLAGERLPSLGADLGRDGGERRQVLRLEHGEERDRGETRSLHREAAYAGSRPRW